MRLPMDLVARRVWPLVLCAALVLTPGCSKQNRILTQPFPTKPGGRSATRYSGTPVTWRVAVVIVTPRQGEWVLGTTPVDPVAKAKDIMFANAEGRHVKALFAEMSYGRQLLDIGDADVFRYDLTSLSRPPAPNNCATAEWRAEADSMSGGAYATGYDRIVYVFPPQTYCASPLGEEGGLALGNTVEIYDYVGPSVYAHELGHSVGLGHSTDAVSAYGDLSCPMGGTWSNYNQVPLRQMNAAQKISAGWLDADSDTADSGEPVVDLKHSGTYTVAALITNPTSATAPSALRFHDPADNADYVISYRTASGIFDGNSFLTGNIFAAQGRAYYGSAGVGSTNIHKQLGYATEFMACLNPGPTSSWQSPSGEITVTQVSGTASTVTLNVQIVGHPTASSAITPNPRFGHGAAGLNLHSGFSYALTNHDEVSHNFAIAWSAPAGVSVVMPSSMTVGAGATVSTSVLLDFAEQQSDGDVVFTVTATAGALSTSVNGTYRVDNTGPTTPNLLSATSCVPSDLAWTASTDAGSGVHSYQVYRDGVSYGEAAGTTFSDASVLWGGTHAYKVKAVDAIGNASGLSNEISVALIPGPITISPSQHSGAGGPGIPYKKKYTITVTNKQCGSGSDGFNLTSTSPQWFECLIPATITVPRGGGTAQFTVTLNFTETAPSGPHAFTIHVTDADVSSYTLDVQGSYVVTP